MGEEPGWPLCVLLPEIGLASETFLRWDVEQLLPGRTVVIAEPPPKGRSVTSADATTWRLAAEQPALLLPPVPGDPPPDASRRAEVTDFLRVHRVEVVLVEYLDFADRWFDLLRSAGPRVWLRAHGADVSARLRDPGFAARYRRFRAADGIILPSRAAADRLTALGLPTDRLHVVAHPVQLPRVTRLPGRVSRCVSVGRLVPKKAPLLTLEAFRLAHRHRPDLELDLVGDGPLGRPVAAYVAEHHLTGAVRVHGQLDHSRTLRLIRASDILLHHAVTAPDDGDSEGQPLAILEAMAAGLAVISTRHAGVPEIVRHDQTGRLVDEGDVAGMAHQIVEVASDPLARARLGSAARRAITAAHTTGHARRRLRGLLGLTAKARAVPAGSAR